MISVVIRIYLFHLLCVVLYGIVVLIIFFERINEKDSLVLSAMLLAHGLLRSSV